jgi:ABC-type bacteriocin/lantibiotic exporter with double-glycine peptidase domain
LSSSSSLAGRARLALLGGVIACGCYHGTARSVTLGELGAEGGDSRAGWERVVGVPEVRQVAREDCGAAALAMVLGYWGSPAGRDEIAAASSLTPERGIRAAALRDFARHQGLEAFVVEGQLDDLDREIRQHHPVLVGMMKRYARRDYSHYEVVVGINRWNRRVLTLDPAHGLRVNSREGFAAEWAAAHQVTLVVFPRASSPRSE